MYTGEARMTGTNKAFVAEGTAELVAGAPETEIMETRFGKVSLSRKQPIVFASGLLGLPDKTQFALVPFPAKKFERFQLLQSLDDAALSFITLPLDLDNGIIARAELEQAGADLNIEIQALAVLLIVSVHRETTGVRLSVNARAPILMHAQSKTAHQYVFASSKYSIRHVIAL